MDKYEYLTGQDLNYKLSTVEEEKFDYSLLRNFLIKDWKKRAIKRLKIKGKTNWMKLKKSGQTQSYER